MKSLFKKDTHPITLYLATDNLLKSKYALEDWRLWESEVIAKEINDYLRPSKLDNQTFNKIMAIKSLYTTDAVWNHWEVFLSVMQALNGVDLNTEIIHITDHPLPYLYNTVEIMNLVRKEDFSEEVKRFCAAMFLSENVFYCPEPLEFAQIYVSQPVYTCKTCGKQGSALPPFQFICEDCSGTYDLSEKNKVFNYKPVELSEKTTNVEVSITHPIADIKKRYDELKNTLETSNEVTLEENEVEIQVGKLLLAIEYVGNQLINLQETSVGVT